MNLTADTPQKKERELKGWHVLAYMMAFFGCMFAVNGVFLYYAITTHPGEDVKKSYLQGLRYNDTLDARARQAELGWSAGIGFSDNRTAILVEIQDASGIDMRGLNVTGELRHISSRNGDQDLVFVRRADGLYAAAIDTPTGGTWSIQIEAATDGNTDIVFEARKELSVP